MIASTVHQYEEAKSTKVQKHEIQSQNGPSACEDGFEKESIISYRRRNLNRFRFRLTFPNWQLFFRRTYAFGKNVSSIPTACTNQRYGSNLAGYPADQKAPWHEIQPAGQHCRKGTVVSAFSYILTQLLSARSWRSPMSRHLRSSVKRPSQPTLPSSSAHASRVHILKCLALPARKSEPFTTHHRSLPSTNEKLRPDQYSNDIHRSIHDIIRR